MNPFLGVSAGLFDLDGTLVETPIDFPFMKREMLRMAESRGVDSSGIEHRDILGIVEEARIRLVNAGRTEEAARFRSDAFARLEEIEIEQCRNPNEIPGAAELLHRLHERGVRIGIVTRNCRRVSLELLCFAGLPYDALVTRDDVPLTKPHPIHLQTALNLLAHPSSHPSIHPPSAMIGDHWMDVQAGRAVGAATVGILHGRDHSFFDPAPPDLIVERTGDLLALLP